MLNLRSVTLVHLASFAALAGPAAAQPYVPADDSLVLERLPRSAVLAPELRALRAAVAEDPDDLRRAVELAWRYVELGRRDADPRWNGWAQAVLAPWWEEAEPPAEVLLLRATLRQNRHDFDAALEDLERLLRRRPRDGQAWLTRAMVLQVQGELEPAEASCQMARRLAPSVAADACLAHVASRRGRAAESHRWLAGALEARPAEPAERVWALTTLADIAVRLGHGELAEEHFQTAVSLGVRDPYLLAAYADFLLEAGRPGDVLELLDGEARSDALGLRRAIALRRLDDTAPDATALADQASALAARFAAARRRGEARHADLEARFLLEVTGRPAAALELALANWRVQREDVDARLVLDAAFAAGEPRAAAPVVEWIRRHGLEDVRLAGRLAHLEKLGVAAP